MNGTERRDREGLKLVDGTEVVRVVRTTYVRKGDEDGVCPFCRSEAEWVDITGFGGTYRTTRYECDCGAHGVDVWTLRAGSTPVEGDR